MKISFKALAYIPAIVSLASCSYDGASAPLGVATTVAVPGGMSSGDYLYDGSGIPIYGYDGSRAVYGYDANNTPIYSSSRLRYATHVPAWQPRPGAPKLHYAKNVRRMQAPPPKAHHQHGALSRPAPAPAAHHPAPPAPPAHNHVGKPGFTPQPAPHPGNRVTPQAPGNKPGLKQPAPRPDAAHSPAGHTNPPANNKRQQAPQPNAGQKDKRNFR